MQGAVKFSMRVARAIVALAIFVMAACDNETPVEAPPIVTAATSAVAIGPAGPVKVYTGEEAIAWAERKLEMLRNAKPDPDPERRARAMSKLQEIIRQSREAYGGVPLSVSPSAVSSGPALVGNPDSLFLSESVLNITSAQTYVEFLPGGEEASTAGVYLSTTTNVPATISHEARLFVNNWLDGGFLSNQTTSPSTFLGSTTEFPQLYACYSQVHDAEAKGPHAAQESNLTVQVVGVGFASCGPSGGGGGGDPGGGGNYQYLCSDLDLPPGGYEIWVNGFYEETIFCS